MADIFKVKIGLSPEDVFEFIEKPYSQQIYILVDLNNQIFHRNTKTWQRMFFQMNVKAPSSLDVKAKIKTQFPENSL